MSSCRVASFYIRKKNIGSGEFVEEVPQILKEIGVDKTELEEALKKANVHLKKLQWNWKIFLAVVVPTIVINAIYFGIIVAVNKGFKNFGKQYHPWALTGLIIGTYYLYVFFILNKAKNCILDLNQKSKNNHNRGMYQNLIGVQSTSGLWRMERSERRFKAPTNQ